MKNWLKLCLVLVIIVVYMFSINTFADLVSYSQGQTRVTKTIVGGQIVEINVGQSVSVSVTRPRWYGTIYEQGGVSYLHLFDTVLLPHKIKKYNFVWFHVVFLIILVLFTILIFTKGKIYKEEIPSLEHEELGENSLDFGQ